MRLILKPFARMCVKQAVSEHCAEAVGIKVVLKLLVVDERFHQCHEIVQWHHKHK